MSKLLFDESPLVVQPTLAKAIGLNEAIVLQQINYWMNQKGVGKTINGERWIYNTVAEWQENFPFWSEETIKRTIYNLQNAALIKTGNYNKSQMDRTKWYTINFDTVEILEALIQQEKELAADSLNDATCQNDLMDVSTCYDIPETTSESTKLAAPPKIETPIEVSALPNCYAAYFSVYVQHLSLSKENELVEQVAKYEAAWQVAAFKRAFEKEQETGERWGAGRRLAYSVPILRDWKEHGGIVERGNGKGNQNNFKITKTSDGGFYG